MNLKHKPITRYQKNLQDLYKHIKKKNEQDVLTEKNCNRSNSHRSSSK